MRFLIRGLIAAAIILPLAYMGYRRIQNIFVAREAQAEWDKWYIGLEKVPPEENGAPIIRKALKNFSDFPWEMRPADFDPTNASNLPKVKKWLVAKADALAEIEKGMAYPRFQYATDMNKVFGLKKDDLESIEEQTPSLANFKFAIRTFIIKGRILESQDKTDEAFNEYFNALRLAVTFRNENLMLSRMFEVAGTWVALQEFRKKLETCTLSARQLRTVLAGMKKLYREPSTSNINEIYETQAYGSIKAIARSSEGAGRYWRCGKFCAWYWNFRSELNCAKEWKEFYEKLNLNPAEFYKGRPDLQSDRIFRYFDTKYHGTLAWALNLCGSLSAWECLLEEDLLWRGMIAMAAIRLFEAEHGNLPDSLDELKELVPDNLLLDPCSGKQLIYRRQGNDFLLYSTGADGKDDGGVDADNPENNIRAYMAPDMVIHKPRKRLAAPGASGQKATNNDGDKK